MASFSSCPDYDNFPMVVIRITGSQYQLGGKLNDLPAKTLQNSLESTLLDLQGSGQEPGHQSGSMASKCRLAIIVDSNPRMCMVGAPHTTGTSLDPKVVSDVVIVSITYGNPSNKGFGMDDVNTIVDSIKNVLIGTMNVSKDDIFVTVGKEENI